ncbi:hypothetical protein GALL_431800 [mine drainage metagenome]|uniref:Uncharacterized protein n=1 Tax=mine drainage metagenome TaxID=410659 RepID=A0A1J5QGQ1_9ZZZZ
MAIIHHHQRAIAFGQRGDLWQRRQKPVHREHAIRRDQDEPRAIGTGPLQLRLQIAHVGICIAIALRLAQPYAVDDRGMVQRIRNHRVLWPQQWLEQPAIRVKARREQD